MAKLFGVLLLIAGAILLYYGWEAHTATPPQPLLETVNSPRPERSIWLLAVGAVALVWGLFALLPRRTAV